MKYASKIILLVIALVVLTVMILVRISLHKPRHEINKEVVVDIQRKGLMGKENGWPMFHGGPQLQGYAQNVLPDSLTVLWKFKTNGEIKSSPAIDDGVVFIGPADCGGGVEVG